MDWVIFPYVTIMLFSLVEINFLLPFFCIDDRNVKQNVICDFEVITQITSTR